MYGSALTVISAAMSPGHTYHRARALDMYWSHLRITEIAQSPCITSMPFEAAPPVYFMIVRICEREE